MTRHAVRAFPMGQWLGDGTLRQIVWGTREPAQIVTTRMTSDSQQARSILIVDDEADLLEMLRYNLEREGFRVITAVDGVEGIERARTEDPDLIVLDIMMPKMNGIEVCQAIRCDASLHKKPVIMLTARTEDRDYIEGLDVGADIYLGKPVSIRVFISQIHAIFRSTDRTGSSPDVLIIRGIEINRDQYLVVRDGNDIRMPRKEFDLLYFLASNPGKVFGRQELLDTVWGHDVYVVDRTVDVHVCKLREKLGDDLIETVTGVGYKLNAR